MPGYRDVKSAVATAPATFPDSSFGPRGQALGLCISQALGLCIVLVSFSLRETDRLAVLCTVWVAVGGRLCSAVGALRLDCIGKVVVAA